MALSYAYKAKDRGGQIISGNIEGDSAAAVVAKLRQSGYTVLNVNEKAEHSSMNIQLFKKKVKMKDVAVFSRQFATMINSGLSLTKLRSTRLVAGLPAAGLSTECSFCIDKGLSNSLI